MNKTLSPILPAALTASLTAALSLGLMAALPQAAQAASTISTVNIGPNPFDAAISPDNTTAYVTSDSGVTPINLATGAAGPAIPAGSLMRGLVVSPDGARVYAVSKTGQVAIISAATKSFLGSIPVPNSPEDVAITPDGKYLYVTRYDANKVSVIATSTNTQVAEFAVGNKPLGIAITPSGSRVYVANFLGQSVSAADARNPTSSTPVVQTIPVPGQPSAVATDAADRAYVSTFTDQHVAVINAGSATVDHSIPLGQQVSGVALSPDASTIYAALATSAHVAVIPNGANPTPSANITVGNGPYGIAISPNGTRGVVANDSDGTATILALAPKVANKDAVNVTGITATAQATVTSDSDAITRIRCYYATSAPEVAKGAAGSAAWHDATPVTLAANQTATVSCPLDGLTRSTLYYTTFTATDADGTGLATPLGAFVTRPKKPAKATATPFRKSIRWTWPATPTARFYQARIAKTDGYTVWTKIKSPRVTFKGLQRRTKYSMQYRAVNDSGAGPMRTVKARTR